MTVRVAINGFGRIGRNVVRALYESGRRAEITVVAINELADAAGMAHLLKYDTSHGRFAWEVRQERDQLFVGDDAIRVLHERSLQSLPWRELGVDVVLDCTGVYGSREHGEAHIAAGAKKVLFSHPGSNDLDATTEDDVLEQLDAQDNLFSFMKTAHTILLQGIRQFLPSLFVDNDEEIVEYAVKPLLAQSGPLDDIDVALRLIYALGKMDKWLYADITHFSQFWHYLNEQDETPGFADDMTWDFISNVNSITRNAMLYDALKAMKFADFSVWSEARFSGMVKTALTLAVTTTLKELTP